MSLALWLLFYMLVTFVIGKLWEVVAGWKTVGLVFYPGMLVAAGGRLLAALAGHGQKGGKADLMRADGPSSGEAPQGPLLYRFLYSVGPFVAALAVFVLAWQALDEPVDLGKRLPRLGFESSAVGDTAEAATSQLGSVLDAWGSVELREWQAWVFLYLGFACVIAPAPSRNDLVAIAGLCLVLGGATFALTQAGVDVVAKGVYRGQFWEAFSALVGMSLLVLVLSCLMLLPVKLLRRGKE